MRYEVDRQLYYVVDDDDDETKVVRPIYYKKDKR